MPLPALTYKNLLTTDEYYEVSAQAVFQWIWNTESLLEELRDIYRTSLRLPLGTCATSPDRRWHKSLIFLIGKAIRQIEKAGDIVPCANNPELLWKRVMRIAEENHAFND